MRTAVRDLAAAHKLRIWDREVIILADAESIFGVGKLLRKAIFVPIKRLLRKVLVVLTGKKMVDIASEYYHRGWMIDHVFEQSWCAPAGDQDAKRVRQAIDEILKDVPVAGSPVTTAMRAAFEKSQGALGSMWSALQSKLGGVEDESADLEVEDSDEVEQVVDEVKASLGDVPVEHFEMLAQRLRDKLA